MVRERPVTTSISLEPSKLDALDTMAVEKNFNSRNSLIASILSDWLEKENKKKKF